MKPCTTIYEASSLQSYIKQSSKASPEKAVSFICFDFDKKIYCTSKTAYCLVSCEILGEYGVLLVTHTLPEDAHLRVCDFPPD